MKKSGNKLSPPQGRGATFNPENRFEELHSTGNFLNEVDHWEEESPSDPKTQFLADNSKTILTQNASPDIPFRLSINPYRGCEHGCIYCYARPTHEYLGFSSGIDFESKILVKFKAPELLKEELQKKSYTPEVINISGVTDCYQPIERKLKLTRACLEVLRDFANPFTIITKNFGVTRDIDILTSMASQKKAAVFLSITTLDAELGSKLEPRTSSPRMRLSALQQLTEAGIPAGVMLAPVIPGLTDHEMPKILSAAYEAGARWAGYVPLRLPLSVAPLFEAWLETHYPDRKNKVIHHIQSLRGGKMNDARFKSRMQGEGIWAEQIKTMFQLWTKKLGFNQKDLGLKTEGFLKSQEQLSLL